MFQYPAALSLADPHKPVPRVLLAGLLSVYYLLVCSVHVSACVHVCVYVAVCLCVCGRIVGRLSVCASVRVAVSLCVYVSVYHMFLCICVGVWVIKVRLSRLVAFSLEPCKHPSFHGTEHTLAAESNYRWRHPAPSSASPCSATSWWLGSQTIPRPLLLVPRQL